MAEKLNLSEELIAAWEKGEKGREHPVSSISKIFGISIDELLGVSENKSSFNPLAGFALPILDFNKQDCNTDNDDEEDGNISGINCNYLCCRFIKGKEKEIVFF